MSLIDELFNRENKGKIGYVRYADDMLIAVKKGVEDDEIWKRFFRGFYNTLKKMKLSETAVEMSRGQTKRTLVL